jgi:hypothetical protein
MNDKTTQKANSNAMKENLGVMVYANIKIIDLDTKEVLVNKRA